MNDKINDVDDISDQAVQFLFCFQWSIRDNFAQ